ncbi:SUF system Fe-S cluster assembly protein [Devosia sp.]|uniref:SUF system Fe-S cluster assembly protein n=1 Tax=Devosia sp. TaxID=1871048 RepID=UPI0032652232
MTDEPEIIVNEADIAPAPRLPEPPRITPGHTGNLPEDEVSRITSDLIGALKTVYDPEIPVDIYELGLIYKVDLDDDHNLSIDMTLTAPGCPVAGEMPGWVENAARAVEGIQDVTVNMVFDPPWDATRMSEEAQVALNWW